MSSNYLNNCRIIKQTLWLQLALLLLCQSVVETVRAADQVTVSPVSQAAPSREASQVQSTAIVARVNGAPIFQGDVDRGAAELAHGQKVDAGLVSMLRANSLQQIIDRTLLNKFLSDQKLMATKEELDAAIDDLRSKFKQQGVSFDDYLAKNHQSESVLRAGLGQQLAWNKFVRQQATDENLQKLFDQFHEQFDGTQRRVSHILLRPEEPADQAKLKLLVDEASKLRDQIKSGAITFEAAAEKYSAGPSRHNGGDLGFIPAQGVMVQPFSEAAFGVPQGEISPPVLTPFGVHLIKVTDVKPGKKTMQDVREALLPALSQLLMNNLTKQLVEKSKIEYSPGVPHFKPGTSELDTMPESGPEATRQ
jgi:parvulin-like peptidyl-prolyl isomerase